MNCLTIGRAVRKRFSISTLVQFGARNQMIFGGAPRRTLRSWKSESLDTIVKSPFLLYC